ncbi:MULTISPECIES: DUF2790 domain-containing protein [Pseudomonas]|uniref:DUF2790 domain-containing protein n=1 Tax=Pseudomonas quercus TaxID=2722792 RepID=A0ABX0YM57_9PSED|nr:MULTISPECIES: DUF2790 domain-containing protein [Pseudomonas]MBF7144637.1 DUF2790 domain-containing protein [Pseudomonas sp. LY10J]NJP03176.1 DUF2790 domain-containing protein [Pseudomonas quercus]
MTRFTFTLSACIATFALGTALPAFAKADSEEPVVEHYTYATTLDVAHVVSVDPVPNVCQAVPVRMTYDDSQGQRHVMEYEVMGNGCTD